MGTVRSLGGLNGKSRIAPAPPMTPAQIPEEEEECTCSLGSREWVDGSIPRRVKKLSWDDDSNDNDNIRVCSFFTKFSQAFSSCCRDRKGFYPTGQ